MPAVAAIGFLFGALIGSFLNVVVWRVPRGMSLVRPPSTCPKCGRRIRPWENIPILSWLLLGGKCAGCHLPISWRYPAGEAATGCLYAMIAVHVWQETLPWETLVPWFWFAGSMLSLARIDWEHRVIPNRVTYPGMAAALLCALFLPLSRPALVNPLNPNYGGLLTRPLLAAIRNLPLPEACTLRMAAVADCLAGLLLGLLLLGAVYVLGKKALQARNRRKGVEDTPENTEVMGLGDVKMLAMTGAFLGADAVVFLLAGGTLLGFAIALLANAFPKKTDKARGKAKSGKKDAPAKEPNPLLASIPFAPAFAIPALLWTVAGNWLWLLFGDP